MGAPVPELEAAENASAEALLSSLKTIAAKERRKHASVFNYWLSIRGNRQFPPIRDLDPLEISDAGPFSVLLEMIGGGENAEIRHLGQAIKDGVVVERISDAPSPSLLSCIHSKLPIVAACRQAYAFEEGFETADGTRRCWVTLLPFSATGTWVDYVYAFVSLDESAEAKDAPASEAPERIEEAQEPAEMEIEPFTVPLRPFDEEPESAEGRVEPVDAAPEAPNELPEQEPVVEPGDEGPDMLEKAPELETEAEPEPEPEPVNQELEALVDYQPQPETDDEPEPSFAPVPEPQASKPGFSAKLLEGLANLGGFYGQSVPLAPSGHEPHATEHNEAADPAQPEAIIEVEPVQPTCEAEGTLQNKLNEVRAKAEEAREAQQRAETALIEGLSAAYDFALDAEGEPEEYLRLVEAQGLKIQLRSPMKPVVKLGFDGVCDEATIGQLEAVLAWALKMDLPRGSLAERIAAEGGVEGILNGQATA